MNLPDFTKPAAILDRPSGTQEYYDRRKVRLVRISNIISTELRGLALHGSSGI